VSRLGRFFFLPEPTLKIARNFERAQAGPTRLSVLPPPEPTLRITLESRQLPLGLYNYILLFLVFGAGV